VETHINLLAQLRKKEMLSYTRTQMMKMVRILLPGLSKLRTAIIKTLIILKGAFTANQQKYTAPESF